MIHPPQARWSPNKQYGHLFWHPTDEKTRPQRLSLTLDLREKKKSYSLLEIRRIYSRQAIMRIFTYHERSFLTVSKSQKIRYAINSQKKKKKIWLTWSLWQYFVLLSTGQYRIEISSSSSWKLIPHENPKNKFTKSSFKVLLHGPQMGQPMSMECENHTLKGYETSKHFVSVQETSRVLWFFQLIYTFLFWNPGVREKRLD